MTIMIPLVIISEKLQQTLSYTQQWQLITKREQPTVLHGTYQLNNYLCHEWLHRQWFNLAFQRSHNNISLAVVSLMVYGIHLHGANEAQLTLFCVGGAQSIGSTVTDAILHSWLWSTATGSSPLGYLIGHCRSRFSLGGSWPQKTLLFTSLILTRCLIDFSYC